MIQNRGGCHDLGHTDYSQIFQIVAGWCLAMDVGETRVKWRRTEDVYRSPTLCNLVRPLGSSGRATPAPDIHYRGNVKNIPRPTSVCKRGVPPCPPVP
jgi:hypothetical protein